MNLTATMIIQSAVFLVFVWFCMRFIWPPMRQAMQARQQAIATGLAAAEEADKRLTQAKSGAEAELAKAKEEAAAGQEVFRKVVNISSIAGTGGNAGQINYSAAKAGILGVTRTMAKEWGRYKVNVNAVAFGPIRTRLTEGSAKGDSTIKVEDKEIKVGVNPDLLSQMERMIPLGRVGTPQEAAGAVYLFCSPESNFISGQHIICGGGFVI